VEVFGLSIKLKEEGAAAVESSMKRLNLAAAAVTATIGVGLVAALKKTVSASIEAQAVQAQLASAIRSTGGVAGQSVAGLNDHAAALQKVSNFGDEAINKAQSLLLTFTKIQGDTFPKATEAVLDVATAMGTDLQSAAIQVGKALNDPILGVTALARSGIQFTQSQKDTIKTLVETGQQAEAQRLILKELEVQFGGSAKAARETLGGALSGLKNAFGDLFEVSQDSTRGIVRALNGLERAIVAVNRHMADLRDVAKAAAVAFVALKLPLLVSGVGALASTVVSLTAAIRSAGVAQWALNAAMAANPIGLVIAAAAAATLAFDLYLNKQRRAIDAADEASAKNPAYLAALESLRVKRLALTKAEEDAAAAAKKVAEETKHRTENLAKLAGLTAVTRGEYGELMVAERGVSAQLAAGNVPLSERIALLEKQRDLLGAIAGASVRGERERLEVAGARQATERATALRTTPVAPPTLTPVTRAAIDAARRQVEEAEALVRRAASIGYGEADITKFQAAAAKARAELAGIVNRDITQGLTQEVAAQVERDAQRLAVTIEDTFAAAIATSIVAGIAGGIESAIASGSIAQGFTALGATMLAGLGDAAIRFGIETMKLGSLMEGVVASFGSLLPGSAIAKGALMVAFGAALKGAAGAAFGGGRPVGRTSTNPLGALGGGMGDDGSVTRLLFGQTSATTAAGMQPRQATHVTIIGPDDPKAQRAIEELITKGHRRGTLG